MVAVMTKEKTFDITAIFIAKGAAHMNKKHESTQTIPYVKVGDYYFPNFTLPPDAGDIGFWGRRRKDFLREHRPVTFNQLVLSGELFKYLALFNQEATERLESVIQAMKVAQGITEEIKGRDQMAWVGAMNNIRACAEEIVYLSSELCVRFSFLLP